MILIVIDILQSQFGKLTTLSQTFQEDPSCQLLTVLRKYLRQKGSSVVESAVEADTLPQLITIQKGILALTRQWKNVLYMPNLTEMDFKSQKSVNPYRVTFAVPMDSRENLSEEEINHIEQFDVVDEHTSLLMAEGGSVHPSASVTSLLGKTTNKHGTDFADAVSNVSGQSSNRHLTTGAKSVSQTFVWHSVTDSPEKRLYGNKPGPVQSAMKRNDSNYSFHSAATSLNSIDQQQDFTPPTTPIRTEFGRPSSILKNTKPVDKYDDLYAWMAKREDFRYNMAEEER